jgi:hypothetical protein
MAVAGETVFGVAGFAIGTGGTSKTSTSSAFGVSKQSRSCDLIEFGDAAIEGIVGADGANFWEGDGEVLGFTQTAPAGIPVAPRAGVEGLAPGAV